MTRVPTASRRVSVLAVAIIFLFLAACARDGTPTPQQLGDRTPVATNPAPAATATGTTTPTATPSPTATDTPTPTPTPTATALPARVSGDPRAFVQRPPEPQPGAACGIVDIFDFPVGPPDAAEVNRGGTDYNRFRERYDGFHAGEDWSGPNGRNLGSPVYSIGHGRVIYAHPNGWGVDQGVLIVQHVLASGSTLLSFYGHLDPPSVVLRGGECVARGDKVGEIGDPRGRPHLHFEIRNHMPGEPGPGYWFQDPTLAGWFPPSRTIWGYRMAASPGYAWALAPDNADRHAITSRQAVGFLPGDVLVLLDQGRLRGLGAQDGSLRWTQPAPPTPTPRPNATPDPTRIALEVAVAAPSSATLDEQALLVYTADRRGRIQAYSTEGEVPAFEPLWQEELDVTGNPTLYPLPGGGVVVVGRREIVALDQQGGTRWEQPVQDQPDTAIRAGDYLFMNAGRSDATLWIVERDGATAWSGLPPGTPVGVPGNNPWLYNREGLYQLDLAGQRAELVYLLPRAISGLAAHGSGAAVALPDGGVLVAHPDVRDRRLLRLDAAGALLWERSYRDAGDGEASLTLLGNQAYLALADVGATTLVDVFSVNLQTGDMVRLFNSGTRDGRTGETWLLAAPTGTLLVNVGGGHLVALDPRTAAEVLGAGP